MRQPEVLGSFIEVYKKALNDTKIGLVLGAGVSQASKVPGFSQFALEAFLAAYDSPKDPVFKASVKPEVRDYIKSQLKLRSEQRKVEPEEVFLLTKLNFHQDLEMGSEKWNQEWTLFCAKQLYNNCIGLTDWRVRKALYDKNTTLNALITFCAAAGRDLPEPWKNQLQSSEGFRAVGINPRIGGILTTNYDSLFEASFNHKYTRSKGRKYGMRPRVEGSEAISRFDRMLVAHIHGYLSHNTGRYVKDRKSKKDLVDFVSAETDYFKAFYESMRFGNYAAMSFMDNYHTLFVGCSMVDQNIRRFLFHLKNFADTNTRKFAILRNGCQSKHKFSLEDIGHRCLTPRDLYYEKILKAYGVDVIWICDYKNILPLLKYIYEEGGGDWDYVWKYKWPRDANNR
jgi:hypothetical protein